MTATRDTDLAPGAATAKPPLAPAARYFVTARPAAATAAATNWRISDSRTGGKRIARYINGGSACGCPPSRTKSQPRRVGDL